MKMLIVGVLGLALCVAAGPAALAAPSGETTVVKSTVTLNYAQSGFPPYDEASSFSGKVKGKNAPGKARKVCRKGRKVTVSGVGKTKTDATGNYEIPVEDAAAPGIYTAKVKKKTIRKQGDKIVCKKAKKGFTVS